MVYVVQSSNYASNNVIGLYESLYDALVCATAEEALSSSTCEVSFMDKEFYTTARTKNKSLRTTISS